MDDDPVKSEGLLNEENSVLFVFVPGPFEQPHAVWTYGNGSSFWPQDLSHLLKRPVRTYVWKAYVDYTAWHTRNILQVIVLGAEALLRDLSRDTSTERVVFVAHTLGGSIVKAALCQSSETTEPPKLAQSTAGVLCC